tara:strand:+ start:30151 stop:31203 length:1053 start_codon:yes stop_codon:yes gene_type:complete
MLEEDLADNEDHGLNNFLDGVFKFVNLWGTLGIRVIFHDAKLYLSSKPTGKIHRIKCGIRGALTTGVTALGVLLPTVILPDLGLNLQSVYLQIMGFLPGAAYVSAVLTVALILSTFGAMAIGKGLDYLFNHHYKTSHTKLYFTPTEMAKLLKDPNLKTAFDNPNTLNNTIEFLQAEFSRKYGKAKQHKTHIQLLTISDDVRGGNIASLKKYLDKKLHNTHPQIIEKQKDSLLTPREQAAVFLQKEGSSIEWQRRFLLVFARFLNNQPARESGSNVLNTKLRRVSELLNLLSLPEEQVAEILAKQKHAIDDTSTTPLADAAKSQAKAERAKEINLLLKELSPNVIVQPRPN